MISGGVDIWDIFKHKCETYWMLLIPGENMFFICMIVIFQGLSFSCQLKALREWAVKEALVHKVFSHDKMTDRWVAHSYSILSEGSRQVINLQENSDTGNSDLK